MSFNLLDSVRGFMDNDFIANASNVLGENESNMQKAISGTIPAVLTGILDRTGSGEAGNLLGMAKETYNSGVLSNLGRFFTDNSLLSRGADLLRRIFGERLSTVSNVIASYSGIRPGSATSLLSVAAPVALAALGKHAGATNMNSGSFLSFINNQKESILNAIPSGLNLAGAFGLSSLGSIGNRVIYPNQSTGATMRSAPAVEESTRKKNNWLVPAFIVLAIGALLWLLMGRKTDRRESPQSTINLAPDSAIIAAPPVTRAVTPATIMVQLPNGTEINAYKGGIEDQLVQFLKDPSQKVDKNTWFDFDNVNFETGSANIVPESRVQIQNIAAILKAFPHAAIKIGGYTDKTGDESNNMKLSQARAEAVFSALKDNGIAASQLTGAEGYGSQFAKVAVDAPDEERKTDRRMAVNVQKK